MERRLTERGRERREQILAFATRRFAENGYHPTSVAEIVAGVGVGKGVFYWYFDTKDDLFLEILRDAMTDLRRAQHQLIAGLDDPVERIVGGIRASARWSAAHADIVKLTQFAATDERFAPVLRRGQEVALADTVRHVEEGIARGLLRDTEPELIAHAIVGLTGHLVSRFINERGRDPDLVADIAASFILEGVRPPGGPSPAPPDTSAAAVSPTW